MQRHSWEQGVAMQAMLESGDMATLKAMARDAALHQLADGRAAMVGAGDGVTDPCSTGEGLLRAGERAAFEKLLYWAQKAAPRNQQGILYHLTGSKQMWVDSMYMLPPFLTAAGDYEGSLLNLYGYHRLFHCPETGLMAHMWDDEAQAFIRKAHWGVGNGWALAGMVRVQALLPAAHAQDRQRIQAMIADLLAAIRPRMRADGLFYDVIDDPSTFVETNLAQMTAYTLYRGIHQGWLSKDALPWAEQMREAAIGKVDAAGFVQGVCGAPHFNAPGIAAEGQAFFLLMESAREILLNAVI